MPKSISVVLFVVLAMWLVRIVDAVLPVDLNALGLQPRTWGGLIGIPLSPFLHAGFGHLFSNTVPLVVLLWLTVSSRRQAWPVIVAIVLGGGGLLWIFGRNANHVGASGLVFGLIAYLIAVGIRERELKSVGIAMVVGIFFGGTLIGGVLPSWGSTVSWDGHLCGAIAGGVIGVLTTSKSRTF